MNYLYKLIEICLLIDLYVNVIIIFDKILLN